MTREAFDMRHNIAGRRAIAMVGMIGGWLAFLSIGLWEATTFDPSHGQFAPSWVNFVLIGSVAVAISGGTAASRLSLGQTLIDVFKAGLSSRNSEDGGTDHNEKD